MDEDGKEVNDGNNIDEEKPNPEQVTPITYVNALKGVSSFHTLMITNKWINTQFLLLWTQEVPITSLTPT